MSFRTCCHGSKHELCVLPNMKLEFGNKGSPLQLALKPTYTRRANIMGLKAPNMRVHICKLSCSPHHGFTNSESRISINAKFRNFSNCLYKDTEIKQTNNTLSESDFFQKIMLSIKRPFLSILDMLDQIK